MSFTHKVHAQINFSSQVHPIVYTRSSSKYDASRIIYLFSNGNKFYVYNFKSNKIIKIDEELAFILEGRCVNETKANIINNFKTKYKVNKESASNIVDAGVSLLKKSGFTI